MKLSRTAGLIIALIVAGSVNGVARAQIRIVNFNIAQLNGNQVSLQAVFAALATDDKPGFALAPALFTFQEVGSGDVGPLLTLLNNAAPGVTYTQGTYTNFSENSAAGAQAMYYRNDIFTEDASGHLDIFTQAGRYGDRWKLSLDGYTSPATVFYVYSCHLKASTGSSNATLRTTGATAIRNDADLLPAGTHIIYAGDWNVYDNGEGAYLKFLSAGNGQAIDPLSSGSWGGIGNAIKHTQAPCNSGCSLVSGGLDDRFDFQVSTAAFQDGEGLAIIPGTYRSLGNDGNHYNTDINAGNNSYYPADIPRSNTLAGHLKVASDHIPVVAEYQIPAVMAAVLPETIGQVIQGAAVNADLQITNAASVIVAGGADELDYSVATSGALSGSPSGSVAALAGPVSVPLAVDTSTVGAIAGAVEISSSSQAAANVPMQLELIGNVLRGSNGSFSQSEDVDHIEVALTLTPETGLQPIDLELYNIGYDADQATLDVDAVDGVSGPFGLSGPLPTAMSIDPGVIGIVFDTDAAGPGTHSALLIIHVSDQDLPGEMTGQLTVQLDITLGIVTADVDCDNDVDDADIAAFSAVLLLEDTNPCHVARADFNFSGSVNGEDVPGFIMALTNP